MSVQLPMAGATCCETAPLPRLRNAGELVTVYKALADETRLRILSLLKDGEVCVCHIHGGLRMPQPTVSRHLAYLRRSGLVEARREGVWMHYRLKPASSPIVRAVIDAALHAISHAAVTETDAKRLHRELSATAS